MGSEMRQDQRSITDQLTELMGYAVRKGMYDAADWIRSGLAQRTPEPTEGEGLISERMASGVAYGLVLQAREVKATDEAFAEQLREAAWVIYQLAASPDADTDPERNG